MYLQLLGTTASNGTVTGITAANGQPSGATAGVNIKKGAPSTPTPLGQGFDFTFDECGLWILGTRAGGTAMTATFRLWAYNQLLADWVPYGVGGDTTKGIINQGNAIGETKSTKVLHLEKIAGLRAGVERLYLELTSLTGTPTSPSFVAYLAGN